MHGTGVDLVDPNLNYHVCRSGEQVAAFLCWGAHAQVPGYVYDMRLIDVGWGLAPDLAGQGLGAKLIRAVLQFVGAGTGRSRFRATVAEFNQRCRRACRSVGFREVAAFESAFDGRQFMILHAELAGGRLLGRTALGNSEGRRV